MHDAAAVRLVHGGCQHLHELRRFARRLRPVVQPRFQRAIRYVFHRKERPVLDGADLINLNQIGVLQTAQ